MPSFLIYFAFLNILVSSCLTSTKFSLSTFSWLYILCRFSTSHSFDVLFFNDSTFFTGFKLTSFVLHKTFNWIISPTRLFPSVPLASYSTYVFSSFQRFDFRAFQISSTAWEIAFSTMRSMKAFLTSLSLNFHIQTLSLKTFLAFLVYLIRVEQIKEPNNILFIRYHFYIFHQLLIP